MNSDRDLQDIREIIETLKNDPVKTEKLKQEIKDRNLEETAKNFEKQYGGKLNDFIANMNKNSDMSTEEKAKMMLEMKNKLPKKSRRQLDMVMGAMKDYLKKM